MKKKLTGIHPLLWMFFLFIGGLTIADLLMPDKDFSELESCLYYGLSH